MHSHEKESLNRITEKLKAILSDRLVSVHAFGSRVRGDHGQWSDFDVLVVVQDKEPGVELEIIGIFVYEEFFGTEDMIRSKSTIVKIVFIRIRFAAAQARCDQGSAVRCSNSLFLIHSSAWTLT